MAVYRWRSFGLDFVAYHARSLPFDEARQRLEDWPIPLGGRPLKAAPPSDYFLQPRRPQGRPYNP